VTLRYALLVAGLGAVPGCSGMGPGPGIVTVSDNIFEPRNVSPAADGTVTWIWNGSNAHDVIFADGIRNAPAMSQGVHTRDFSGSEAGTYAYQCTLHGGMVGTVVVP
jgi:plastocyanin